MSDNQWHSARLAPEGGSIISVNTDDIRDLPLGECLSFNDSGVEWELRRVGDRLCKTCKWWENEPVKYLGSRRRCYPDKLVDCVNDAVGIDNEYECETEIYTGPDYGCIHWEAKDG